MLDNATLETLRRRSFDLRIDNLTAIAAAESGHPGGTLSAMDILQTLYFVEMNHRPKEPNWPDRDRFVLSKGHAVGPRMPAAALDASAPGMPRSMTVTATPRCARRSATADPMMPPPMIATSCMVRP